MRKINKTSHLSVAYFDWLANLDEPHPNFGRSGMYYWDVIMNLYYCQDGLCAYTEKKLCRAHLYPAEKWSDNRYQLSDVKPQHLGHPDHYNPATKPTKAWDWNNLLMICAVINNKKSILPTLSYLKPDSAGYSPFLYLSYNFKFHRYEPNDKAGLTKQQVQEIEYQINNVLFLNFDTVIGERETLYKAIIDILGKYENDWDKTITKIKEQGLYEFPTLIELTRQSKQA